MDNPQYPPPAADFCPRVNTQPPVQGNQIASFGIPGVPFPQPVVASPVYSQGEDVIYDGRIYVDGAPIDLSKWVVSIILKKSEFSVDVLWNGVLGNGLYYTANTNMFQIWIPATVTAGLLAGLYWFDVVLTENVGSGTEIKSRRMVVDTESFSIKYTMSSPAPDTDSADRVTNLRPGVERTYPNLYNPLNPSL